MTYRGTFTRTLFDASWEKKKTIIVAENAAEIPGLHRAVYLAWRGRL